MQFIFCLFNFELNAHVHLLSILHLPQKPNESLVLHCVPNPQIIKVDFSSVITSFEAKLKISHCRSQHSQVGNNELLLAAIEVDVPTRTLTVRKSKVVPFIESDGIFREISAYQFMRAIEQVGICRETFIWKLPQIDHNGSGAKKHWPVMGVTFTFEP